MNKLSIVMVSLGLCSMSTFAGTMGEVAPVEAWVPVMTLSLGPVWPERAHGETRFLTPDIEKTYTVSKNDNTLFDGELFYGWQHRLSSTMLGQLGIAVAATTNNKISGHIWDDADPLFDNFVYSYKINHTQITARGKLLADWGYRVMPYLNGSVGVGFNRAHHFTNTPTIPEAIVNPNFHSHTETTYSYTAGVGFEGAITERWHAGVGYEFTDWGNSHLNRASGQTLGHGLSQKHIYTNGLMFNISYFA